MILLFAFDDYCPNGGTGDLVDAFPDLDAALAAMPRTPWEDDKFSYPKNAEAYDTESLRVVAQWRTLYESDRSGTDTAGWEPETRLEESTALAHRLWRYIRVDNDIPMS